MSSNHEQIPLYAADGSSLGFRLIESAKRLIAGGYVKPAYGRKGHLKAIWFLQQDGWVLLLRAVAPHIKL